jgi:antitoxin CptB
VAPDAAWLYIRPLGSKAFMDDTRLKRLKFRAWHRGFREADLILGPFADSHADSMTPEELDQLETLLEQNDHDIYGWIVGRAPTPPQFENALMARLRAFEPSSRGGGRGA